MSLTETPTVLDAALALAASGLSVIPIKPDGSKSPTIAWAEFQTRGQGGYALTVGSPAACHRDRKGYRLVRNRLTQIPRISPAQRALLLDAARSFNRVVRPAQVDRKPSTNGNGNGARPGDVLN